MRWNVRPVIFGVDMGVPPQSQRQFEDLGHGTVPVVGQQAVKPWSIPLLSKRLPTARNILGFFFGKSPFPFLDRLSVLQVNTIAIEKVTDCKNIWGFFSENYCFRFQVNSVCRKRGCNKRGCLQMQTNANKPAQMQTNADFSLSEKGPKHR